MSENVVQDLFARVGFVVDKGSSKKVESFIGDMRTALNAFIAYKGFSFFKGMISETANIAGNAVDMAAKLGISAEAVQELDFAAKQSGTSMDGLKTGLITVSKNLEEARKGSGPLAEGLKALGISTRDQVVQSGDLDGILMKVADRIGTIPPGAKRAAVSMKVFGKSGSDLLPMLSEGAVGIARLRKEARDLGGVIDNETASSLEAFGDEQEKAAYSIQGLKNSIVIALLPAMRELTADFLEWMKTNRKVVAAKIASVIKGIGHAFVVVGKAIKTLFPLFRFMVDHWKLITLAVIAFKAASIQAAIASGVAWAVANAPLLLMIGMITAVVLIVQDLWTAFTGGRSVLKDLYLAFKEYLGESMIGGILLPLLSQLEKVFKSIASGAQTVISGLSKIISLKQRIEEIGEVNKQIHAYEKSTNAADKARETAHLARMQQKAAGSFEKMFPAAKMPAFLGGGQTVNAPVTTTINVNSATGDPRGIGDAIKSTMDDVFKARARAIQHATGSGGVP